MSTLDLLAQAGHHGGTAGNGAVFSFAVLLAGVGIGGTYVADSVVAPAPPPDAGDRSAGRRKLAAAASLAGAALSAAAVRQHLGAALPHTVVFAAVALAQLLLAGLLLRSGSRRVVRAAFAGSAWILLLWLVTRTMGVAFLSARLPFGPLDTAASVLGLAVLGCCRSVLRDG